VPRIMPRSAMASSGCRGCCYERLAGLGHGLEQIVIDPVSPVVPVVPFVVCSRPVDEMLRVQAQPIMAAVPDDLLPADHSPVQDAVDEAIGRKLMAVEAGLPRAEVAELPKT
jgi:hypothetical protein